MMFHEDRHWSVQAVHSAEELAEKLLDYSWCGCSGFELDGFLWLNDSTSPDALQEYAVVKRPIGDSNEYRQVESITVSWCNREQLLETIRQIHDGENAVPATATPSPSGVVRTRSAAEFFQALGVAEMPSGRVVHPHIESPDEHGRCCHCA